MITVQEIYQYMDEIAPFAAQEKWDNSGLLVGDPMQEVQHVMVTLDITRQAVDYAMQNACSLIISHHPVIFSPLQRLTVQHPAYWLAAHQISAICSHTPLDIAAGGINDILVKKLGKKIVFTDEILPLDAAGCGRIVTLAQPMTATEIAEAAKEVLGCQVIRCKDTGGGVTKLGICSGSGASMIEEVADRCDALLTGDVKHDRWYAAEEHGLSLIDCGHYHTEVIMVNMLAEKLRERFPELSVFPWEGGDPVAYV